jgi:hypothetical protein
MIKSKRAISLNYITSVVLLIILSLVVIFHLLILVSVVPFNITWGGRLEDISQMYLLETVSIIINLLMLGVVAIHAGFLKLRINQVIVQVALWVMVVLFLLNTVGNYSSQNQFEKTVFTPLTLLLSILCLTQVLTKRSNHKL